MKISIDLDGVLARFMLRAAELIAEEFPNKPGRLEEEPDNWFAVPFMTVEEWSPIFKKIKTVPDFWLNLEPYEETVNVLREFLTTYGKIDAYFITARVETVPASAMAQSAMWLKKFGLFPREGHSSVIRVASGDDKATLMRMLKIDFSIDDYGPTVFQCASVEGHKPYLLNKRYNKDFNVPRVATMEEFLDKVATEYWKELKIRCTQ